MRVVTIVGIRGTQAEGLDAIFTQLFSPIVTYPPHIS